MTDYDYEALFEQNAQYIIRQAALEKAEAEEIALIEELTAQVYASPLSHKADMVDGKVKLGILMDSEGDIIPETVEGYVKDVLLPQAHYAKAQKAVGKALTMHEQAASSSVPVPRYKSFAEAAADTTREPAKHRVEGLSLYGGNVLLSAQAKTGKTSLIVNLVKALVDGDDFLGRKVTGAEGNVVVWDLEQEENYSIDHYLKRGIVNKDKLQLINGAGLAISMESDRFKRDTVQQLKDLNAEVWIIDTMSQAFNGDPDKEAEVKPWLNHVKEIKAMAGVKDVYIIGHAGHNKDDVRQRGSSFFLGAFDSLWTFQHESGEDSSRRVFKSKGRGIQHEKITCDWEMHTNTYYTVDDALPTKEVQKNNERQALFMYLTQNPESSLRDIGVKHFGYDQANYNNWRGNLSKKMQSYVRSGDVYVTVAGITHLYSLEPVANIGRV